MNVNINVGYPKLANQEVNHVSFNGDLSGMEVSSQRVIVDDSVVKEKVKY